MAKKYKTPEAEYSDLRGLGLTHAQVMKRMSAENRAKVAKADYRQAIGDFEGNTYTVGGGSKAQPGSAPPVKAQSTQASNVENRLYGLPHLGTQVGDIGTRQYTMPQYQPKTATAKAGEDYTDLANRLGVDELDLIKANPNDDRVVGGASYNLPPDRLLQEADRQADFQAREARRMMGTYGISELSAEQARRIERARLDLYRQREAGQFGAGLTDVVGGSFANATYYGPTGNVQMGPSPRGAEERASLREQAYSGGGAQEQSLDQGARELTKLPIPPNPTAFEAVNWLTGQGLTGTALLSAGRELRLDRPEYWDATGAREDILEGMEKYLVAEFGNANGEIDWDAAEAQDPYIYETLMNLGYIDRGFGMDGNEYYYPTPRWGNRGGGGGGYSGGSGGGYPQSNYRNTQLGLVSWSI